MTGFSIVGQDLGVSEAKVTLDTEAVAESAQEIESSSELEVATASAETPQIEIDTETARAEALNQALTNHLGRLCIA